MSHIILSAKNNTYDISTVDGSYRYLAELMVEAGMGSLAFECLTRIFNEAELATRFEAALIRIVEYAQDADERREIARKAL